VDETTARAARIRLSYDLGRYQTVAEAGGIVRVALLGARAAPMHHGGFVYRRGTDSSDAAYRGMNRVLLAGVRR
jgi:hypothetical protein